MRRPAPPRGNLVIAYPPHPVTGVRSPNPRQALMHACPAQIIFYGGARGGGKTEGVGTEAARCAVRFPGIQMLLVRRTREEMKLQILPVLDRIFAGLARWSAKDHQYVFFNGSVLNVEFIDRPDQIGRYLGAEFGMIFVDQAEQMTEASVMALLSCLRSTKPWPKRMILTGNPGIGIGVGWLRRWFIKPTAEELHGRRPPKPCEIWRPWPRETDPTPPEQVPTRCFIPARFQDNDALRAAQPNYLGQIYTSFAPAVARAQAEGDWDASEATIVGSLWAESFSVSESLHARYPRDLAEGQLIDWHVIHNREWRPPKGALIYGSTDYGFGSPWAFHLHAVLPGGHTRTFYEIYKTRVSDSQQGQRMRQALHSLTYAGTDTAIIEGLQWIVYDPIIDASRQEMGLAKSIKEVYIDELGPRVQLIAGAATRAGRMARPNRWLDALAVAPDGFPWWSVTTACPDLIRTVPEVPWDPDDPDVEDDASENHCYEDTGRFFAARPHAPRVAPPDPYAHLDAISAEHHRARDRRDQGTPGAGPLGGLAR